MLPVAVTSWSGKLKDTAPGARSVPCIPTQQESRRPGSRCPYRSQVTLVMVAVIYHRLLAVAEARPSGLPARMWQRTATPHRAPVTGADVAATRPMSTRLVVAKEVGKKPSSRQPGKSRAKYHASPCAPTPGLQTGARRTCHEQGCDDHPALSHRLIWRPRNSLGVVPASPKMPRPDGQLNRLASTKNLKGVSRGLIGLAIRLTEIGLEQARCSGTHPPAFVIATIAAPKTLLRHAGRKVIRSSTGRPASCQPRLGAALLDYEKELLQVKPHRCFDNGGKGAPRRDTMNFDEDLAAPA